MEKRGGYQCRIWGRKDIRIGQTLCERDGY
jgi:hypothetical protein